MQKSLVLVAALLVHSAAMANPYEADAPASGLRASYTVGFGGNGSAPLRHSLALSSGVAHTGRTANLAELSWDRRQSELFVAGQPLRGPMAQADGDGWSLSDQQALYLMLGIGAGLSAVAVKNYRESRD